MTLTLHTFVTAPPPVVWAGFDQSLFTRLSPPFPPVRLLRFDGSMPGNVVSLELNFFLFRQVWTSRIVEQQSTDDEIYFIDQGTQLPFFLKMWRHKHRLIRQGNGTVIADEITFEGPNRLLTYLLYPVLWAQFAYRKPIYRRIFNQ